MISSRATRFFALVALLMISGAAVSENVKAANNLPESEARAIRAVLERCRKAWLAGDADGVRGTFTQDAVLMPHHGLAPVVGMKAINDFWWAPSTAKTTITKFIQTTDEVSGDATLAYLRGRSEVAWTIEDQGKIEKWRTGGNYLALLKKQANGTWLISHLIWDDPPNELVK